LVGFADRVIGGDAARSPDFVWIVLPVSSGRGVFALPAAEKVTELFEEGRQERQLARFVLF
jgi:hypothetical protein